MQNMAGLEANIATLLQQMAEQLKRQDDLIQELRDAPSGNGLQFPGFDPSSEVWKDYYSRFETFSRAHSLSKNKAAFFLSCQTPAIYQQLADLAIQKSKTTIHKLSVDEITTFMGEQYDPAQYTVRERFRFWSNIGRRPGESVSQLASRIRKDAATCDFGTIADPLDEALRTRFVCSIQNDTILKQMFKTSEGALTFDKAVKLAMEMEEASKAADSMRPATQVTSLTNSHGADSHNRLNRSRPKRKKKIGKHLATGVIQPPIAIRIVVSAGLNAIFVVN